MVRCTPDGTLMENLTVAYDLGGEDEGWRRQSEWLWLENSGEVDNDFEDDDTKGRVRIRL